MNIILYLISFFCLIATVLPLISINKWWIRGFDFPHAQLTLLTATAILLIVVLLPIDTVNIALISILSICFIYQFYIVFPYTRLSSKQVLDTPSEGNSIKIFSCNVLMHNRNSKKCLVLIKKLDPDLVLLVETDQWWYQETQAIQHKYPYRVTIPLDNTYGMLLYSKFELTENKVDYLVESHVPSIHAVVKVHNNLEIKLHCLHPAPPSPTENESSTERDAELLLVAKKVNANSIPTIVMGDLNDVAWSSTTRLFQKISGLLDPRIGRGFFNTYHASYPLLRWPLDHIFHSNHFKLAQIRREEHIDSDHFPIYVELSYDLIAPLQQPEPEREQSDVELANQKIQKAL